MKVDTCDYLLKAIVNMTKALACLESSLSGETSNGDKFAGIDLDEEMLMLRTCTKYADDILDGIVSESIKAHMNRYLYVHNTLENKPMSEEAEATGYAELGAEGCEIEKLFRLQDVETRSAEIWEHDYV